MSYSSPGLLTDESRWLAKIARIQSMMVHREDSSVLSIITVTTDYTMTEDDYTVLVDTSGGNVTVYMNPSPPTGKVYNIKLIEASNTLTIDGNGVLIDGNPTETVTTLNESLQLQFDGTNYLIL